MALSLSAPHCKTANEWKALSKRKSAEGAAEAYAKAHMVAVIHCADDSAILFLHDVESGKVRRTTKRDVEWGA